MEASDLASRGMHRYAMAAVGCWHRGAHPRAGCAALRRNPHFDLTYLNLGQIAVGRLVGTASEFVRNTHHVKDGFGAFSVGVVAEGPVLARNAGQEHCLSVGSGLFFDHSRPHSTVRPNGGKVRNIFFPVAELKALVANPEDRVGQVVRPGPAMGLLDGYMASLASLKEPPSAELGP